MPTAGFVPVAAGVGPLRPSMSNYVHESFQLQQTVIDGNIGCGLAI